MNIVRLILNNLRHGAISFRMPHRHECTSNRYRGLIHNDPERCIGCGSCAYVCPTGAIEVTRGGNTYTWAYDPGKCTFCARCIDRCRPNTLTIESQLPPLYSVQGELKQVFEMEKKRPVRPAAPAQKPEAAPAPQAGPAETPQPAAQPSPAV